MNNAIIQRIEDLRKELIQLDEEERIEMGAKEWNDICDAFEGLVVALQVAENIANDRLQEAMKREKQKAAELETEKARHEAELALAKLQQVQYVPTYIPVQPKTNPYQIQYDPWYYGYGNYYVYPYYPYNYPTYTTSTTIPYSPYAPTTINAAGTQYATNYTAYTY